MSEQTLSVLVHGASKAGKSTLGSTTPQPICVLDAEGSWNFIRHVGFCPHVADDGPTDCACPVLRSYAWDPIAGPPPRHDGSWDLCRVLVRDWRTLEVTLQWLTQSPHDFKSLVFDSITEAQRRLKQNLRGNETMRIQDWGDLLVRMDSLIRGYRDLVLLRNSPLELVMFIAETREDKGKWRPYMQGQIGVALPYWMDVVGYFYVEQINVQDANGQTVPAGYGRRLLVGPHPQYESGERVQGTLPHVINEPNMTTIFNRVFRVREPEPDRKEAT